MRRGSTPQLRFNTPAAVAWALLTDTHAWPQWGPSVRTVEAPTRFITAGMRGRVQTTLGPWLPFEITDWEEGATGPGPSPESLPPATA